MATALPGLVPPTRLHFSTTDPDQAQEFIDRMYAARPKTGPLDRDATLAISQVSAYGLSYADVTLPLELTLRMGGTDDLSVNTRIAGRTQAELGQDTERYAAGDVCLGSFSRGRYLIRCWRTRAGVLTIPAAALVQVAGSLPGWSRPAPWFTSLRPVSPSAAERWRRAAAYARDVLDDDEVASSRLIVGGVSRLLAATALETFPNTLLGFTGPDRHARRDAHPDTVRRAVAFIEANAQTDITVADIAAAAFVGVRAVQLAFRRHLNCTPLIYLRRVRLDYAHRILLAADPATGITVTAVAARCGFANPNRFATVYRAAYGRTPSSTLHT